MAKYRGNNSNIPEIDTYLDDYEARAAFKRGFGAILGDLDIPKIDNIPEIVEEPDDQAPVIRKSKIDREARDMTAVAKKSLTTNLKKQKTRRIWSGESVANEGTARRYWTGRDHGEITRTTERKDSIRARKALAAAKQKYGEYA